MIAFNNKIFKMKIIANFNKIFRSKVIKYKIFKI